jgi:hypothetical protein
MRPWLRGYVVGLSLAGATFLAAPVQAQDAAEALFNRGVEEMKAGRYPSACQMIAESQRLDPRPGTLFTQATCEEGWGHAATATKLYAEYLALYETLPEDRRAAQKQSGRPKVAKEHREKLAADVPELTVSLPAETPPGTVVTRDGQVMAAAALGVGLRVDPGEHVLTTQAPGGPVWEQKLTLGKGERRTVALEIRRPAPDGPAVVPPPPPPLPPPVEGPSGRRVASYVVGGVGIAGIAAGAVMGGLVFAKKGTIQEHCGAGIHVKDDAACDPTGLAATSSARAMALGSTVGIAAGLTALGAGLVLYLTEPKRAPPASATRVSPSVSSPGPGGLVVGASGVW